MKLACLLGRHRWTSPFDLAIKAFAHDRFASPNRGTAIVRSCTRCHALYLYGLVSLSGADQ